jgi:hypothetical protein
MTRRAARPLDADAPPPDADPWRAYFRSLPKDKATDECRAPSCRKKHMGKCGWRVRETDSEGHITITDRKCDLSMCDDHLKRMPNGARLCPYHVKRAGELPAEEQK